LTRALAQKAQKSPNWERWDRELSDDLETMLSDLVGAEGSLYAKRLLGDFDRGLVVNYVRAMAEGAATAINAKARDEVSELGRDAAVARFATHTESAGASIGGGATRWAREEAARQSPDPELRMKVWIPDTQRHAEFGGQRVPLGDNWPAGFAPGSAPGCRCTLAIE
jgi:hypothetical protein